MGSIAKPTAKLLDALHAVRTWRDVEIRNGKVFALGDDSGKPLVPLPTLRQMIERGWMQQHSRRAMVYQFTRAGMQAWIESVTGARAQPQRRSRRGTKVR